MHDYTWSEYSPIDNTGTQRSIFKSAYKNVRFILQPGRRITLTQADMANLPGIAYREYGSVSLWRIILSFNGLKDGIQDLRPGVSLILPTKSSVIGILTGQQSNQQRTITI